MDKHLIERRIDALPPAHRTVFVLCALEELPACEVGEMLGMPEASVCACHAEAKHLLGTDALIHLDRMRREAFAFDGERCERIVRAVVSRLAHR